MPHAPRRLEQAGLQTLAIHAGEAPDPVTGASAPNLVMSTTFVVDGETAFASGSDKEQFVYARHSNPTVQQLEQKLAALEGAEAGVAFGSGMAAIAALMLLTLRSGDHVVMTDVAYMGAAELMKDYLPALGVRVSRVNTADLEAVRAALTPATKLVHIETPANPILRLTDIAAVAELAHAAGARLSVDSTYATPVATRPLALGADFVIHSLTKYLGGHGDALGGALLGPAAEMTAARDKTLVHFGGVLSPFNAWLILRGLATLPLRMRAHAENAWHVARFLETHPKVTRVFYPGLPSHPQHALAGRQMRNFSGMVTFQTAAGPRAARVLSERLEIIHYAVSLGHHRSLVFFIDTADLLANSYALDPAQSESYRAYAGDGVFRFSVGLEDPEDLCRDLDQALAAL
ncbi:MAG: PLP-dependent transferase [Anaerolineales bacterium]|nr:PLP-dependent transferase [Anaerolineales bacterium]